MIKKNNLKIKKTYLEKIDMTKAPDDQKNKVSALLTQFDRYLEAVK